jgi:hypothetical protein
MVEAAKAKGKGKGKAERTAEPGPPDAEGHVCTVTFCPICLAVTAGHSVRPDAVEHLLAAGREVMLALSSILGARGEETGRDGPKATLTRIDIE